MLHIHPTTRIMVVIVAVAVAVAVLGYSASAFTTPVSTNKPTSTQSLSKLQMGLDNSAFTVAVLGDLHIDPRKMEDYVIGREQFLPIFEEAKQQHGNVAMVSLGDLGESKYCDHNPSNPSELFAGTTICHEMAAEFLNSFDVPYEVVGGNHGTFFRLLYFVCT
jgi:Calcineurin-like phosphoesterase